jgi:hypothetical protein
MVGAQPDAECRLIIMHNVRQYAHHARAVHVVCGAGQGMAGVQPDAECRLV